jgi:hypothetical protein
MLTKTVIQTPINSKDGNIRFDAGVNKKSGKKTQMDELMKKFIGANRFTMGK